ncbi:potassium channel AKT1 [Spinacia oleracea]|uniref:Potassium channel AKT1 n=1 Tax=Spinacia oleracea TaxID=3562 RepID=A0ABM3RB75_SPIOL|nr:potassium channel AKT1-like [Spinacia oleracea]
MLLMLHIAASNGSEKCVRLLLDYGADPNCRDQEGSITLWDAMQGGHGAVVKHLKNYGANIRACDIGLYACIEPRPPQTSCPRGWRCNSRSSYCCFNVQR